MKNRRCPLEFKHLGFGLIRLTVPSRNVFASYPPKEMKHD